jgi:hypothetical protein
MERAEQTTSAWRSMTLRQIEPSSVATCGLMAGARRVKTL